jgi:hypothetical protein
MADGERHAEQGSRKTQPLTKMVMVMSRQPPWGGSLRGGFQRCEFWWSVPELSAVNLATVLEFARENPRLRFNAVEPGFNPGTGLGRDANVFAQFLLKYVLTLFAPFIKHWSTPKRAARVITKALMNESGETGVYYDERGHPMLGSALVRNEKFRARVVTETRALLSTISKKDRERQLNAGSPGPPATLKCYLAWSARVHVLYRRSEIPANSRLPAIAFQ